MYNIKEVLVIAIERHMLANYRNFIDDLKEHKPVRVVVLPSITSMSLLNKIRDGNKMFCEIRKSLVKQIGSNYIKDTLIVYSNSEGFVLF